MLSIDVVSDVICPWCFIGVRRLDQALESLPEPVDAKVTFHPFLLDASTPAEGADLRDRLRAKYGVDPEKMFGRVEAAARESGIPLDFSKVRRTPNTVAAHTLIGHAVEKGTQRALAGALFQAYFLDGRDIGDATVLGELATLHGFEHDEAIRLATDATELAKTRQRGFGCRGGRHHRGAVLRVRRSRGCERGPTGGAPTRRHRQGDGVRLTSGMSVRS
jgi:predicted DsbA family dithiol-disulfide isomerase